MASKAKPARNRTRSVAKKAAAPTIKAARPATNISAFPAFAQALPQFQTFTMETPIMMKNNQQFEKMAQDAAMLGQDQMDALVRSQAIFAKGMEDMIKTCMEIAQEAGEKSQSAAKTVMSCKTLNEFTDMQTRLAQASFDEFMTNATRLSEKAVKLCTDAMEPINDQMGKSIKRASDAMEPMNNPMAKAAKRAGDAMAA